MVGSLKGGVIVLHDFHNTGGLPVIVEIEAVQGQIVPVLIGSAAGGEKLIAGGRSHITVSVPLYRRLIPVLLGGCDILVADIIAGAKTAPVQII